MVSKKDIQQFDKDSELWDSRQLGASEEHAVAASAEMGQVVDDALGLQLLSFRIQQSIVGKLKELAKLEGIGYQPLMRRILTSWVRENEHRLKSLLKPGEAVRKADRLFAHAIKVKGKIAQLTPLSDERILAEGDYSTAMAEANAIFLGVFEECEDAVLKQHIKLRLSQIREILDQELRVEHDKQIPGRRPAG